MMILSTILYASLSFLVILVAMLVSSWLAYQRGR